MNLNDFSKWLQYNRVKNVRGSEYFPYPLYILKKEKKISHNSIIGVIFVLTSAYISEHEKVVITTLHSPVQRTHVKP